MASTSGRYTFILSWQDEESSLCKQFIMHIFFDNTIELIDMENGKLFQKRVKCKNVGIGKIFVGDVLKIFSRRMEVTGYGDVYTRDAHESTKEKTVGLIKADSIDRIIDTCDAIVNAGCKITKMEAIEIQQNDATHFLFERRHESNHLKHGHSLLAGKVNAIEIVGSEVIDIWRDIVDLQCSLEAKESETEYKRTAIYGSISKYQYEKDRDLFFVPKKVHPKIPLTPTTVFTECTLAIIKPHAVTEGIYPKIMRKIHGMNFRILAIKMHHLRRSEAEDLFEIYRGVLPEFKEMIERFILGPSIGLQVSGFGPETVSKFREALGPRDPKIARLLRPDSIRAEFGTSITFNVMHCTDLDEDGETDCQHFFNL